MAFFLSFSKFNGSQWFPIVLSFENKSENVNGHSRNLSGNSENTYGNSRKLDWEYIWELKWEQVWELK
jgi:hypothetical protein